MVVLACVDNLVTVSTQPFQPPKSVSTYLGFAPCDVLNHVVKFTDELIGTDLFKCTLWFHSCATLCQKLAASNCLLDRMQ